MLRTILSLSVAAFVAHAAPANSDDGAAIVADLATRAIARGHGMTCSLKMEPVRTGGYYPCIDFGPYRVVKEYGRITGFVVREGSPPFQVLSHGERGSGFADGPWVSDMPARIVAFWADVVDGGLDRARRSSAARSERQSAEDYVRGLNETPKPDAAPRQQDPGPKPISDAPPAADQQSGGGVMDALTADQRPK